MPFEFDEAISLWEDSNRLVISAKSLDEPRFALIAEWNGMIWVAIYTERSGNIRIISVRHARTEEKELYYGDQE